MQRLRPLFFPKYMALSARPIASCNVSSGNTQVSPPVAVTRSVSPFTVNGYWRRLSQKRTPARAAACGVCASSSAINSSPPKR